MELDYIRGTLEVYNVHKAQDILDLQLIKERQPILGAQIPIIHSNSISALI